MEKCMSMKHFLIASVMLLLSVCSCQKQQFPPVQFLYAGKQEDNQFQMWIWIFEDEKQPALVRSGMCQYIDGQFVDTDEEHLAVQLTGNGFILSHPVTGNVLYTATIVGEEGNPPGHLVHISWNHSPGTTWDSYAEEKGWLREMTLEAQINEGDDIRQ